MAILLAIFGKGLEMPVEGTLAVLLIIYVPLLRWIWKNWKRISGKKEDRSFVSSSEIESLAKCVSDLKFRNIGISLIALILNASTWCPGVG